MATAYVVTSDRQLADELSRLALVAAVPLLHVDSAREISADARLTLAGPDALPIPPQPGVLLVVTREPIAVGLLQAALASGARAVARLPDDESQVVTELMSAGLPTRNGRLIGVVGCTGGVGASTFAAAIARTAAHPRLLVDCDSLGGGLDLLLGLEAQPGSRWSALSSTRGRISAAALREALPQWHGVAVLSHDGSPTPPEALAAVVSAGVGDGGSVVLDLPRFAARALDEAGLRLDDLVLVVADDVCGVVAGVRVAAALQPLAASACAVLLTARGGVARDLVARSLEVPVVAQLPVDARPAQAELSRPSRAALRAARAVLAPARAGPAVELL